MRSGAEQQFVHEFFGFLAQAETTVWLGKELGALPTGLRAIVLGLPDRATGAPTNFASRQRFVNTSPWPPS